MIREVTFTHETFDPEDWNLSGLRVPELSVSGSHLGTLTTIHPSKDEDK